MPPRHAGNSLKFIANFASQLRMQIPTSNPSLPTTVAVSGEQFDHSVIASLLDPERIRFYRILGRYNVDERAILSEIILDPNGMPKDAKEYFVDRPWLTPPVCNRWRVGYLPRMKDAGSSTSFIFRGHVVYSFFNEQNRIVGLFGVPTDDRSNPIHRFRQNESCAPNNFWFSRSFDRTVDLFGIHCFSGNLYDVDEHVPLLVCQTPDYVIKSFETGQGSVALLNNFASTIQTNRIIDLARARTKGNVTLMFPNSNVGKEASRELLLNLAYAGITVTLHQSKLAL